MTFYRRLIDYGLSVTKRHSSPPVVPVIIIHNTTAELTSLTVASKKQSFLLELPWHDWAKSCYLINAASISSHLQSSPLNPLVALGHFLIQQKPSIRYIDRNDDKTIQEIFGEGLQQHESTITAKDLQDIHDQCTKAKSFLLEDVPNESSPRKIWHRKINEPRKKQSGSVRSPSDDTTNEDWKFTEKYHQDHGSFNWESTFTLGQAKGLFISYSRWTSVKSAYYRYQKQKSS